MWLLLLIIQLLSITGPSNGDCNEPLIATYSKTNLTSSSSRHSTTKNGPHQGRLYNAHAWCAKSSTAGQYLEIDFGLVMMISSIATQGSPTSEEFVKTFSLSFSVNKDHWLTYEDPVGKKRIFKSNINQEQVSTNTLGNVTAAQKVRITPESWHSHVCMRVELSGCEADPFKPLGMASGNIPDTAISASTYAIRKYNTFFPSRGRLHWTLHEFYHCWAADVKNLNQWLQVALSKMTFISGVATQGRHAFKQWVTKYWLSYSNDNLTWHTYQNNTEFVGNNDSETVVRHVMSPAIWTRIIKFRPVEWYDHISMRVEIYSFGKASPSDLGINFEKPEVSNSRISSSSDYSAHHKAYMGRLNYPFNYTAWCSKANVANQWLQFDFGHIMLVTGIVTQRTGKRFSDKWLVEYRISYSVNNTKWTFYSEKGSKAKIFDGNKNGSMYAARQFKNDITARYLKIHADKFIGDCPCFRATALGRRNGPLGAPVFTNRNDYSPIVSYSNENITLDCEAVGDLPMTFKWSFKGHVIQSTSTSSKLHLTAVTKSKSQGVYTCSATNNLGTNQQVLHLQVKDSLEVCLKHTILKRSGYHSSTSVNHGYVKLNFLDENKWYVFKGIDDSYYQISTKCPPERHCEAEVSGHLQNQHPEVSEGIVTRKVCFHVDGKCCRYSVDVLVRKCNAYYVYKLKRLNVNLEAAGYCIEKHRNGYPSRMFAARPFVTLYKHVINTFYDVKQYEICMQYCIINSACKSYNFNPTTNACQLNKAKASEGKLGDLRKSTGYVYYEEIDLFDYIAHEEF